MSIDSSYMTTEEVAATLRRSAITIRRWIKEKRLRPAAKMGGIGGGWLFTKEEVEDCIRREGAVVSE